MINKARTLQGYKLDSRDGEIGKVKEFYFDDRYWTVRYLVADTGNWLTGRQVLISPYALGAVNHEEQNIAVDLTRKQIEDSPSLNTDKPVSRQFESSYYEYYGWPLYWGGTYGWGAYPYLERNRQHWKVSDREKKSWDPDLRSTHDVRGHHIQASDGEIGHVEDFLIDAETWAIRYLVVATRNWWPGKTVLLSPQWIERISWADARVLVSVNRETVRQSPEFTDETVITREYENDLHRHYGRPGYWVDELASREHSH